MSALLSAMGSVGLLVAMAVPGYALQKARKLPDTFAGGAANVIVYVGVPMVTLFSFAQKSFDVVLLFNMGMVAVLSAVLMLMAFGVSVLVLGRGQLTPASRARVAAGCMSNCSFMGIPVMQALFPGDVEPVIYAVVFGVMFNIFSWTLLVYILTGEKKYMRVSRVLINPPTLILLLALPVFFCDLGQVIPVPVLDAVGTIGAMTTPLSMLVLGIRLADIPLKVLLGSPKAYLTSLVKLLLVPGMTLGVVYGLSFVLPAAHGMVASSMVIIMGMPAAFSVVMFAKMYDADTGEAAKNVLLSALLSIVTIPLLSAVVNGLAM